MSTKNITMLRNVDDYVKGQSYQDVAAEQADELIKNGFAKEAEDHTDEVVKRITGAIKDERQYVERRRIHFRRLPHPRQEQGRSSPW